MSHVRADILTAFETAIDAIPIVAGVYTNAAVLNPPSGKVMVELDFPEEGPNEKVGGDWPNEVVIRRPLVVAARIEAAVPRDMDRKTFESDVLAPIEIAIATNAELAGIADELFLLATQWAPAQDGGAQTLEATLAWKLTYTTAAGAPGKAL